MNYISTYEKFWPFKEKSELEKNKEKIISVSRYIMDYFESKKLLEYTIRRVEIGQSKTSTHRLIIQLFTDKSDIIRFNWIINDDFTIKEFEMFYILKNGKIILHSLKHDQNHKDILELKKVYERIKLYFVNNKLM